MEAVLDDDLDEDRDERPVGAAVAVCVEKRDKVEQEEAVTLRVSLPDVVSNAVDVVVLDVLAVCVPVRLARIVSLGCPL